MSRSVVKVTLLALSAVLLSGCHKQPSPKVELPVSGKLRLDGVTIVDTRDGKLIPGMSILMDKGRIVNITPTKEVLKDPLVNSIDATGRFAIPGFNNMHMHVIDQADSSSVLARMLADGVTGFRQMTGSPEFLEERRNGTLPIGRDAPALLVMPGSLLTPFNARSADRVTEEIRQQKNQGADFIKVGLVSPDVFFAASAEGTYSEARCRALAAVFVANDTWNVPTLVRLRTQELADSSEYLSDPALPTYGPSLSRSGVRLLISSTSFLRPCTRPIARNISVSWYSRNYSTLRAFG